MVYVKVMFFSWDSFYSKAIRLATGSKWTHVGLVGEETDEGYVVYEAVNKGLVKSTYLKDTVNKLIKEGKVTIREVEVKVRAAEFKQICDSYEGRPYDWLSIFNIAWAILFGKVALNFSGPKAVICSEFVARVLYDASYGKIDFAKEYDKDFDLITPAEILLSKQLG